MKNKLNIILILGILPFAHGQATKNILFIGNSYTGNNNLAGMISTCATSAGDAITFDTHTPGGSTFSQHSTNSVVEDKIAQGNWDYVVLQEQSQRPAMPDAQVETQVYPHAAKLDSMIRHHNPCAETVFYMTWGRKNGDASNCPTWPPVCTYSGMDSLLNLRYMTMAENNDAIVSPVGAVWNYIRQNHPNIDLYTSDESHPSLAGSYAAACCFYTVIFRKNPQLITWNSNLDAQTAFDIREAVKVTVFVQMENWFIGSYDPFAQFSINNENAPIFHFQNNSINATAYEWYINGVFVSNDIDLFYDFEEVSNNEVTLIASNCDVTSSASLNISSSNLTPIHGLEKTTIIYPNPFYDIIQIDAHQEQQVSLMDMNGRLLQRFNLSAGLNFLDLSRYPAGFYLFEIDNMNNFSLIKN